LALQVLNDENYSPIFTLDYCQIMASLLFADSRMIEEEEEEEVFG
jgi:hypothetical protein